MNKITRSGSHDCFSRRMKIMVSNSFESLVHKSKLVRAAALFFSLGLIAAILYAATLCELVSTVIRRDDSSHGLFVPLLSLFFIWRKRSILRKKQPKCDIVPGLLLVAGGLLLFSVAGAYDFFFWECFTFVMVLVGFTLCFFGMEWVKEILFPALFLISMIPIPSHLYQNIGDLLRQGTFETSTQILYCVGIPFLIEGPLIHLPSVTLSVGIDCSGIRYLLSYFVFGMAYAYLYKTKTSQRILVVGSTIPISLMGSTLRLTAIALLAYYIGPHMAEYWPHVITSWLVFFSILVFFIFLDRWMVLRKERQQD